ncbi:NAD-dependent epimerase/dehydratase family protein [Actinomadura parmotrematis]|uniref:NAD(P)-dependent oxidoreductase n=1 Tax=Actinomadura parmotrematis TaxID=2864039 RepID=A0ABS7G201_9ACTN|nr:NAD(P)-dependent oxidoreductase [Actinomadura parmotrematis]MBW8486733.1 NAD(P)-dependent oxidoreductase [Actinomadura parmotrematis]
MSPRHVLVTGAAGHIGSHVCAHLAETGHRVTATDRIPAPAGAADRYLTGDLRDRDFVAGLMDGVDAVVHLAAIPSPHGYPDDEIFTANAHSAYLVLDEAGRAGAGRAVVASSLSVLGLAWAGRDLSPAYAPVDEDHPILAEDPYALSKQAAEATAAMAHRRWGIDVVALRFPFVGTGDRLAGHVRRTRADPAETRRELWAWLDTRDAARVCLAGLRAPLRGHHVLNAVAPTTMSDRPTAELLAKFHPGTELRAALPGRTTPFAMDRCAALLGFVPRHTEPEASP